MRSSGPCSALVRIVQPAAEQPAGDRQVDASCVNGAKMAPHRAKPSTSLDLGVWPELAFAAAYLAVHGPLSAFRCSRWIFQLTPIPRENQELPKRPSDRS
jgi:hypothetical protein